jgi:hypothetical protein
MGSRMLRMPESCRLEKRGSRDCQAADAGSKQIEAANSWSRDTHALRRRAKVRLSHLRVAPGGRRYEGLEELQERSDRRIRAWVLVEWSSYDFS